MCGVGCRGGDLHLDKDKNGLDPKPTKSNNHFIFLGSVNASVFFQDVCHEGLSFYFGHLLRVSVRYVQVNIQLIILNSSKNIHIFLAYIYFLKNPNKHEKTSVLPFLDFPTQNNS